MLSMFTNFITALYNKFHPASKELNVKQVTKAQSSIQQTKNNLEIKTNKQASDVIDACLNTRTVEQTDQKYFSKKKSIEKSLKLKIVKCGGNGNCLLYSIMKKLDSYKDIGNNDFNHIKEEIAKQIRQNPVFQTKLDSLEKLVKNLEEHLKMILSNLNDLKSISNLPENQIEQKKQLEKSKQIAGAELIDLNAKVNSIKSLQILNQPIVLTRLSGEYLVDHFKRPIVILNSEGQAGVFFYSALNGLSGIGNLNFSDEECAQLKSKSAFKNNAIPEPTLDRMPKDAVLLYRTGDSKNEHYQALVSPEKFIFIVKKFLPHIQIKI